MNNISYLVLSTGQSSEIERDSVYVDLLGRMGACLLDVEGQPVETGWSFNMFPRTPEGTAVFIVRNSELSLLTCYLAWSPDADKRLWGVVKTVTRTTCHKPNMAPWAAVHEMPHAEIVSTDVLATAYDMCRSMILTLTGEAERSLSLSLIACGFSPR